MMRRPPRSTLLPYATLFRSSPRTATITGTPAFGSAGSYSIVFTVNDGSGATNATASTTTVLTIAPTNNQPPTTTPATANTGLDGAPAKIGAAARRERA